MSMTAAALALMMVSTVMTRSFALSACLATAVFTTAHVDVRWRASVQVLREVADLAPFRRVEPRLSIDLPYSPFRLQPPQSVDALANQDRRLALAISDFTRGPADVHFMALANLVLGQPSNAVATLASSDRTDDASLIDKACAYYMRGLTTDSLHDFARALQVLESAHESPHVLFNRALILEQLCDREAAAQTWRKYLAVDSEASRWRTEAEIHLERDLQPPASRDWATAKELLLRAALDGRAGVAQKIVEQFPLQARQLVENEILPEWGSRTIGGDASGASGQLNEARAIAACLKARSGERLLCDAVGEIDAAGAVQRQAVAQAYVANRNAVTAISRMDYHSALTTLLRARASLPAGTAASALLSVNAVTAHYYLYDYTAAEDLIDATTQAFRARADSYIALRSRLAAQRGLIRTVRGDPSAGVKWFKQSLAGFTCLGETEQQASQLTNLADTLEILGETEEAAVHRRQALLLAEQLDDPRRLHPILSEAAEAVLNARLPAAALVLQNRLVRLASRSGNPLQIADARAVRSTVLVTLGQRSAAVADLREARASATRITDVGSRRRTLADIAVADAYAFREADDARTVEDLTEGLDFYGSVDNHVRRAQLLLERGRAQLRLGKPAGAEADFRAGIVELERSRRGIPESEYRITFFDRAEALFSDLALALLKRGDEAEAFDVLERSRARELLDASTGRPMEPLPLPDVLTRMPARTTLVFYTITPRVLIVSVLNRAGSHITTLPVTEEMIAAPAADLAAAFQSGNRLPPQALRRLRALLIDPLPLPATDRLIIVPDKILYRVPFAALWDTNGTPLVAHHTISFTPSATLFARNLERDCPPSPQSILMVASAEQPDDHPDLDPLTHAPDEAAAIAALYPRSTILPGQKAESLPVLSLAKRYEVLQIDGHSVVSTEHPAASQFLIGYRGALRAAQIERTRLPKCRLVVLGTCSSGVGRTYRGEGEISLARAFLTASVPTVLQTVAPVKDSAATALLSAFHAEYVAGSDPAAALRRAQLRLLRSANPALRDPKSWSAFEVIGGTCRSNLENEERDNDGKSTRAQIAVHSETDLSRHGGARPQPRR